MKKHKTLKHLLACLCIISLLINGCSSAVTSSDSTAAIQTQLSDTAESTEDLSADAERFDAFTREMFIEYASQDTLTLNYTLKNPSAYGIELDEVTWGDVPVTSEDFESYKNDTLDDLSLLNSMEGLTGERALTCDILKYYLTLELEAYDYIYFTTNFAPMLGVQSQLPITMAEYAFDDISDVDDYLILLNSIGDYFDQLIAFEDAKISAGFGMCASAIRAAIEECVSFSESVHTNMLIEVFPDKLDTLDLSEDEKNAYIQANENAVLNSVLPAYTKLVDFLSAQLETAPEEGNLASYENGTDYYRFLLKSSVGTDKTPEELIRLTEQNLTSSIAGLSLIMMNNENIYDDMENTPYAQDDPEAMIEHFKETMVAELFPEAPEASYTLKNVHESMSDSLSPAMYFIPRIDDLANNQIYLNIGGNGSDNELMPTMAHEGYPGHMYQMTYYYSTDPDPIRTVYENQGYLEGWASYVEGLSYDYCGFSEDLADFYRIFNTHLSLNLYCRLDLGIHYENWSLDEAGEFLTMYLALDDAAILEIYEAVLYNPTNYLIYGIGMEEIYELRENTEANLGESFDIKDFHKQLLDIGPAPFPIIQKYMPDASEPISE